jgi:hypothetical protein
VAYLELGTASVPWLHGDTRLVMATPGLDLVVVHTEHTAPTHHQHALDTTMASRSVSTARSPWIP